MGGCQNYDLVLGTLNISCRIIMGIQKREHNFDNHPYRLYRDIIGMFRELGIPSFGIPQNKGSSVLLCIFGPP